MQQFIGKVIQSSRNKTAKVAVDHLSRCKNLHKPVKVSKNYLVHDEENCAVLGDTVEIRYVGTLSSRKSFEIVQVLKEAKKYVHPQTGKLYSM